MGTAVAGVAERRESVGLTDHELVAAVRRGDNRAFEKLYERYQRRIAAYIYGMVSDYGRAEDITQEVFISALRRMRETERPIAFKPWIYEIAKNACIDQFRRSRRAEEISFDAEEGMAAADYGRLTSPDAAPEVAVDNKQQLDHLCGAFGGLSETHHEILVLRELEGLSYREIGEKMGLSRPSVESTLFRARRRLTEEYDELVSGQRCIRIQTVITNAAEGSLGARDQRRLARHIAHCQPCRREARLAGLDSAAIIHRPVTERVAAKVAALFPFPALFRGKKDAGESAAAAAHGHGQHLMAQWGGPLTNFAEPAMGWGKAAVAAGLVLAGVAGGGVAADRYVFTGGGDDKVIAPAVKSTAAKSTTSGTEVTRKAASKPTRSTGGAGGKSSRPSTTSGGGSGSTTPAADLGATAPSTAGAAPQRSGAIIPPTPVSKGTDEEGDDTTAGKPIPKSPVPVPTPVDDALRTLEDTATGVDGNAGDAVHDLRSALGG